MRSPGCPKENDVAGFKVHRRFADDRQTRDQV